MWQLKNVNINFIHDLNMLSVRTQRPLKLLFKPHDFNGGTYISETDAANSSTTIDAFGTAVKTVRVIALANGALHIVVHIMHISQSSVFMAHLSGALHCYVLLLT
jgi:hypothetical protein